jgi:hypothetical protein
MQAKIVCVCDDCKKGFSCANYLNQWIEEQKKELKRIEEFEIKKWEAVYRVFQNN